MQRLTNTIENKLFSYDPHEFFPIFVDGDLVNKRDFVFYKLKRAAFAIMRSVNKG